MKHFNLIKVSNGFWMWCRTASGEIKRFFADTIRIAEAQEKETG